MKATTTMINPDTVHDGDTVTITVRTPHMIRRGIPAVPLPPSTAYQVGDDLVVAGNPLRLASVTLVHVTPGGDR